MTTYPGTFGTQGPSESPSKYAYYHNPTEEAKDNVFAAIDAVPVKPLSERKFVLKHISAIICCSLLMFIVFGLALFMAM
jgi:hypothetical protein